MVPRVHIRRQGGKPFFQGFIIFQAGPRRYDVEYFNRLGPQGAGVFMIAAYCVFTGNTTLLMSSGAQG